jgi:hypothetical protein
MNRLPQSLTYAQRRVELFGPDAGEGCAVPAGAHFACQRGGLFSGNSKSSSSQTSTDNRIGVESGTVAQGGSLVAQAEDTAISGSTILGENAQTQTVSNATVSGDVNFGVAGEDLVDLLNKQAATTADVVNVAVEGQGANLSSALEKLAATAQGAQTGGASILTKQLLWLGLAGLAVVAFVFYRKKS